MVGPVPSGKPQSLGCVSVAELGVASRRECRVAHWGVPVDDRVEGVPAWSFQVPRTEIPGADRPFPVQEAEGVGRQIEALPYDQVQVEHATSRWQRSQRYRLPEIPEHLRLNVVGHFLQHSGVDLVPEWEQRHLCQVRDPALIRVEGDRPVERAPH